MKIAPHSKWIMIGDSITDAGRSEGGEETQWMPDVGLGRGYANLVHAIIKANRPQDKIRIINRGCSGNTVVDLKNRWQKDVLDYKPDWLSVSIGVNDVWRQFDCPHATENHVTPEIYRTTYRGILEQVRPQLKGLLLIKPHYLNTNRQDPMRKKIDEYGEMVAELSKEFNATLVDPQARFDSFLQHYHSTSLGWDSIHMNTAGHMVIARAVLDAIDFKW